MNNDRVREILKGWKRDIEDHTKYAMALKNNGREFETNHYFEMPNEKLKETTQALDIAIESLEQEKNIKDCIIELQAFDLTLKDLTEVGRIEESVFNTFTKIIKQIIERLEPYERKE